MSSLLLPIQTTGFTVRSSSGELTGLKYANTSLGCQVPQARDVRGDVRGSYPHRAEHANVRQLAPRAELVTVAVDTPSCVATSRTVSKACSTGAANGLRTDALEATE